MTMIRPLTLEIDHKIWNKWKATIPRTLKLSYAIEKLIRNDLDKK